MKWTVIDPDGLSFLPDIEAHHWRVEVSGTLVFFDENDEPIRAFSVGAWSECIDTESHETRIKEEVERQELEDAAAAAASGDDEDEIGPSPVPTEPIPMR